MGEKWPGRGSAEWAYGVSTRARRTKIFLLVRECTGKEADLLPKKGFQTYVVIIIVAHLQPAAARR